MIMIYFLNIMLTWKIVRVSEVSVLYIYINNNNNIDIDIDINCLALAASRCLTSVQILLAYV